MPSSHKWLPHVHKAPNIQGDAHTYEIENRALDPDNLLFEAIRQTENWRDKIVADIGAGTSFWCPHFAHTAAHVFSIEPHDDSRLIAMERIHNASLNNVSIMAGSATQTMLASHSVDIVHVRFAYFWGPGCEPGLAELERIIRPGGCAFIIDNDLEEGTFATWLRMLDPSFLPDPKVRANFWESHGFTRTPVRSCWRFETRQDLEAVVRLEFPSIADTLLAQHEGLEVDYGYMLLHKHY